MRFDNRPECRKEFTECNEGLKEPGILFLGSLQVRLGPGPVFAYEWLTTTRRWQLYALRAGFVGAMLIGMMVVWHNSNRSGRPGQTVSIKALARYGENLYETIVSIELTLVILAAPAATAGAVCLDKARGTLDHMLATDLSNAEIVLGKIGVRLVPVLGLIACVLPLTALTSLLGGIDPLALFGSFMTSIACAALGCSLALTLSVWGRKTHEVLMITYLILIFWLLSPMVLLLVADSFGLSSLPNSAPIVWGWIACSNPYYLAFAPYSDPGKVGLMTYLGFLGVCLVHSALLLVLATVRIRGVALQQAGRPGMTARRRQFSRHFPTFSRWPGLPGPSLDGNPILWREWHRSKPSRLLRVIWTLYSSLGVLWIVLSLKVVAAAEQSGNGRDHEHVSGFVRTIAPERFRRNQPGRGARARQPRRALVHAAFNPLDPGREVVGIISAKHKCVYMAGDPGRNPRGRERALDQLCFAVGANHGQ